MASRSPFRRRRSSGGSRCAPAEAPRRAQPRASMLTAIDGLSLPHPSTPFLWEFVLPPPSSAGSFAKALRRRGIVAGLPLGQIDPKRDGELLVCCTELSSPQAIDRYAAAAADIVTSEHTVAMAHA